MEADILVQYPRLRWLTHLNPVRLAMLRAVDAPMLLKLGGKVTEGHVLEVGFGRGDFLPQLLSVFGAAHVDGVEADAAVVASARKRFHAYGTLMTLLPGDVLNLEASTGRYDAVFALLLLHEVGDWRKALAEMARVLRPGGQLYLADVLTASVVPRSLAATLGIPARELLADLALRQQLQHLALELLGSRVVQRRLGWYVARKR